jgi:hypothetical protein
MKQLLAQFPLFIGLALIVCVTAGCKTTSEAETPQVSTVIALSGNARYWDAHSNKVHVVRLGDHIPQGSTIQTDSDPTNAVTLVIGESIRFLPSPVGRDPYEHNHVKLNQDSVLELNRVAAKTVAEKRISDARLILLGGSAECEAGGQTAIDYFLSKPTEKGPKLETIRPQPNSSYFEIRSSNIVVHAAHAYFFFAPRKSAVVLQGTVAIEFTDTGIVKDLFGFQRYDFVTGEISEFEIKANPSSTPTPEPHFKWLGTQPQDDSPRFSVPKRPF